MIRAFVIALLLLFASGCASARDRTVAAMNGVATFADGAHDYVADEYEQALKDCVKFADTKPKALSCGADVDRKFEKRWKAYRFLRSTWLAVAAAIHAAELSEGGLNEAEALQLLSQLSAAVTQFKEAMK